MRKAFTKHNIDVPKFIKSCGDGDIDIKELERFTFPVIVKPTDRSGSRGITKVERIEELQSAVDTAVSYSFEKEAIIEEFIEGSEYSCECISYQGEHTFLAFTQKFTTGAPHFIETGHIEPTDLPSKNIAFYQEVIFNALDALHIQNGASHCEFKVNSRGEIKIVEIGSRMGGDCIGSDLVFLSTGYDFVEMVIDVACDKKPVIRRKKAEEIAVIKFIFNSEDIRTLRKIEQTHPEFIQYVSEIGDVGAHEVVDSSTRFGFYILTVKIKEQLQELL